MTELPEITDEDRAVAEEAMRLMYAGAKEGPPTIAAALVRTGRKPVDPDLILAREVVAEANRADGGERHFPSYIRAVEDGGRDGGIEVKIALAAIKAVRREQSR